MSRALAPIEQAVAQIVAVHADVPVGQITPDTRLWHDLKLAGDDFAEVIEELHHAHGVSLPGRLGDYCPTEGDLAWAFWWWPFKRSKTYRELTIREMAARSAEASNG